MEPPTGFWASLLSFLKFLPYFSGLLILGFIKGDLLFCLVSSLLILIHAFSSFGGNGRAGNFCLASLDFPFCSYRAA